MIGRIDDIFPQRFHLLLEAKSPHDREVLQRQIIATDRQIDQLVYEMYELTPSSGRQGGGDPSNRRNGGQVGIVEIET